MMRKKFRIFHSAGTINTAPNETRNVEEHKIVEGIYMKFNEHGDVEIWDEQKNPQVGDDIHRMVYSVARGTWTRVEEEE